MAFQRRSATRRAAEGRNSDTRRYVMSGVGLTLFLCLIAVWVLGGRAYVDDEGLFGYFGPKLDPTEQMTLPSSRSSGQSGVAKEIAERSANGRAMPSVTRIPQGEGAAADVPSEPGFLAVTPPRPDAAPGSAESIDAGHRDGSGLAGGAGSLFGRAGASPTGGGSTSSRESAGAPGGGGSGGGGGGSNGANGGDAATNGGDPQITDSGNPGDTMPLRGRTLALDPGEGAVPPVNPGQGPTPLAAGDNGNAGPTPGDPSQDADGGSAGSPPQGGPTARSGSSPLGDSFSPGGPPLTPPVPVVNPLAGPGSGPHLLSQGPSDDTFEPDHQTGPAAPGGPPAGGTPPSQQRVGEGSAVERALGSVPEPSVLLLAGGAAAASWLRRRRRS